MGPEETHLLGTRWENNSCAYDAVLTILFNTWHQNPVYLNTTIWQQMGNTELNMLVTGFNQLLYISQPSLETIREDMRYHFANLSSTMFCFGHYTSVHIIFLTLLKSTMPITATTRWCTNANHAVFHESMVSNSMITVSASLQPQSLQNIMNHFQELVPSRCQS